jgi:hypothetical protein
VSDCNPRTYIAPPVEKLKMPITPPEQKLPAIPPSTDSRLRNLLQAIKDVLENPKGPKTPGPVLNITATTKDSGIMLQWDYTPDAFYYGVYRADVDVFARARLISAPVVGPAFPQFFDVGGQDTTGATRVYWIIAFNVISQNGPVSEPVITVDPGITGGGGGNDFHPLDPDFTIMNW